MILADADVAEEDHVIVGERFGGFWEGVEIAWTLAESDLGVGMKEHTGDVDALVAHESIAEVAKLPTWDGVYKQDL